MGAVWLAVDEVLGREVAVKRVGLFPGGSSPDLLRAQREATLAARLNHPHVVSVFDFVTEGDEQWLVMEYVAGTNLSALADQQAASRLPMRRRSSRRPPRRSPQRTRRGSCTATSSPRTSWSPTTAPQSWPTSALPAPVPTRL